MSLEEKESDPDTVSLRTVIRNRKMEMEKYLADLIADYERENGESTLSDEDLELMNSLEFCIVEFDAILSKVGEKDVPKITDVPDSFVNPEILEISMDGE